MLIENVGKMLMEKKWQEKYSGYCHKIDQVCLKSSRMDIILDRFLMWSSPGYTGPCIAIEQQGWGKFVEVFNTHAS